MAFAVKAIGGIIGSGTVAVGGCGVYSAATGKPVLFFKGKDSGNKQSSESQDLGVDRNSNPQQPEPTTPNPTEHSDSDDSQLPTEDESNKEKYKKLLDELKKGCLIKVKETNGDIRDINSEPEDNLEKLLTFLDGLKSDCSTDRQTDKKEKVLKNEGGTWSIVSEKELLKLLGTSLKNKCTVKVKAPKGNSFDYKPITEDLDGTYEDSLYEKVKKLSETETDCKNKTSSPKEIVLKKDTDSWSVMSEQDQIKDISGKETFKCAIKVKEAGKDARAINIDTEQNPDTLLTFFKKLENDCKGQKDSSQKMKIIKNSSGTWEELSEREYIVELIKGWSKVCIIKVRNDQQADTEVSSITNNEEVTGLYKVLEGKIDDCGGSVPESSTPKEIIYKKEGDSWKSVTS